MLIKYTKEELFKLITIYYKENLNYSNINISLTFIKSNMKNGHNKYVPAIEIKEPITINDITKEAIEILTEEQLISILNIVHSTYGFEVHNAKLIGNNYKLTGNDLKEVIVELTRTKKESLNR